MKGYKVYVETNFNVMMGIIVIAENEKRVKKIIGKEIKKYHSSEITEIDISKEGWYMISAIESPNEDNTGG